MPLIFQPQIPHPTSPPTRTISTYSATTSNAEVAADRLPFVADTKTRLVSRRNGHRTERKTLTGPMRITTG